MSYLSVFFVTVCVTLLMSGCSEKAGDGAAPKKEHVPGLSMHSGAAGQAESGLGAVTEAIRKQTLPEYPAVTIGKAIDGYSHFITREWKETATDSGKYYIDCTGWFESKTADTFDLKGNVSRRGVLLKFVVMQDGTFGLSMISKLEAKTDGNIYSYPLEDAKGILEKIYGNKEIRF